jgi:hypothetical protein
MKTRLHPLHTAKLDTLIHLRRTCPIQFQSDRSLCRWRPYPWDNSSMKHGPKPRLPPALHPILTIDAHMPPHPRNRADLAQWDNTKLWHHKGCSSHDGWNVVQHLGMHTLTSDTPITMDGTCCSTHGCRVWPDVRPLEWDWWDRVESDDESRVYCVDSLESFYLSKHNGIHSAHFILSRLKPFRWGSARLFQPGCMNIPNLNYITYSVNFIRVLRQLYP